LARRTGKRVIDKIVFAAGCFWGVQFYFDQVPGVVSTTVGYSGGHTDNPTYEAVCSHKTGHAEAVLIEFDPKIITTDQLIKHFFRIHDPTQLNQQGPDVGDNYRSAIFFFTETQKTSAENIKKELQSHNNKVIVTEITKANTFYVAEDYHQKFSERTGVGMCHVDYKPIP